LFNPGPVWACEPERVELGGAFPAAAFGLYLLPDADTTNFGDAAL
jgi:hypothetical protein